MTLSFRLQQRNRIQHIFKPSSVPYSVCESILTTQYIDFSPLVLILPLVITDQKLWREKKNTLLSKK